MPTLIAPKLRRSSRSGTNESRFPCPWYFLRKHKGALIGGYRLIKHPGRHSKWSLEKVV